MEPETERGIAALAALETVWPWIADCMPGWAERLRVKHPVVTTLKRQTRWQHE